MRDIGIMKKKPSRLPYAIAVVALALVVVLAWVNRDRLNPVAPGTRAPGFQVADLAGDPVSLDDYRGKVVLVNIWATNCPPCRQEMPSMQRLYESVQSDDFEILAISVDGEMGQSGPGGFLGGDVQAFVDELALTFSILRDPSGEIQRTYQTTGLPESFLVGRDGIIYKKVTGATEWDAEEHQEQIHRLLGE
jgi:cytochrome c biogenesis protein CcmG/thiol:disulfide interchange protein DsbE